MCEIGFFKCLNEKMRIKKNKGAEIRGLDQAALAAVLEADEPFSLISTPSSRSSRPSSRACLVLLHDQILLIENGLQSALRAVKRSLIDLKREFKKLEQRRPLHIKLDRSYLL